MVDRLSDKQLLVKYGFLNSKGKKIYKYDEKKGHYVKREGDSDEFDEGCADEEMAEEVNVKNNQQLYPTGYPNPGKRYKLVHEGLNLSLEELYYWCLNHVRQDASFPYVDKITDIFSASEQSAMFGQSAQRLSIQEDRASSFLRGISEMIKTLFQIVRELRIIDERLSIYKNWKKSKSADVTLKGLYADFAENKGGQMQPGSIYHLSNQVGYATLPDLFFNTSVYDKKEVDKVVDNMKGFNPNVKNVLKRKLYHFLEWKEKTEDEMESRKRFQVKYLRQHYTTIKMYMSWVKPYLKHIKRLSMNQEQLDSPDLISSFESSTSELEVLAKKPVKKSDYYSVVLMTFKLSTRPMMQYRKEFHQGPGHVGRGIVELRSYAWTKHQIDMYKKMRDFEDRELFGLVDDQLQSAMDMLGDDLESYLKQAEGEIEEPEEEKKKEKSAWERIASEESIFDPFVSLFKGFGDLASPIVPGKLVSKKKSGVKGDPKSAMKGANGAMWMVYKNYKKSHGLLSW